MTFVLALCAALAFGASVALQERAASEVPHHQALRVGMIARLVQRPIWLLGVATSGVGFLLQAAALRRGSLVVVQPLMATTVIFALLLVAIWTREWLHPGEWAAVVAVVAGVVAFLLLANPDVDRVGRASGPAWWIGAGIVVVAVGAPAWWALRRQGGRRRAGGLGLAAGLANGFVAVITKAFAQDLHQGVSLVRDWPLWALIAAGVPAVLLVQAVYQTGNLRFSLPIIAVVEPTVASLWGIGLFGEDVTLGALRAVGVIAAVVVAGLGLWRLGGNPRLTDIWPGRAQPVVDSTDDGNLRAPVPDIDEEMPVSEQRGRTNVEAGGEHSNERSPEERVIRVVPAARVVFSERDRAEILAMIDESLRTGSLTLGPHTRSLEAAFAERHDAPHAIAVSSGTSALEIVFRSLGVTGREVIVPANTFFATAAAVLHAGGVPRFADVDVSTLALSVQSIEMALTPQAAGVVIVHIGEMITPEIVAVREFCDQHGLWLVEDAAHAHGSSYDGHLAGSFGVAGAFSFYPTKVITAGEGGMIVTGDERLRDEAIIYRDQGKAGFLGGEHVRLGYAWRMSEVHAAIASVHLRRLDEFIAARGTVAARYDKALVEIEGIQTMPAPPGAVCNYHKYVALLAPGIDRADVKRQLRERGVWASGEVYATPLHLEPVFAELRTGPLPVAEDVCRRQICLPIHSDMADAETDLVVDSLRAVLDHAPRPESTESA